MIGPDGAQLGIMLVEQARAKALELQMDLVEVAPKAVPAVCRIMDFGKYIYQEQKKEQQAHKRAHSHELKEVRLKPHIGKHDLEIKVARARTFLAEGNRVQFTMIYRGREISHQDIGEQVMRQVTETLREMCKIERGPFREGKRVGLIVAPKGALTEAEKRAAATASKPGGSKPASAPAGAPKPAPVPAGGTKPASVPAGPASASAPAKAPVPSLAEAVAPAAAKASVPAAPPAQA